MMWIRWIPYVVSAFFTITAAILVLLQGYEFGGVIISFIQDFFQNKSR